MANKKLIIEAINKGISKALMSFDDDDRFEKSSTSIKDTLIKKYYNFDACDIGDPIYLDNAMGVNTREGEYIGYCCITVGQIDDHARFAYKECAYTNQNRIYAIYACETWMAEKYPMEIEFYLPSINEIQVAAKNKALNLYWLQRIWSSTKSDEDPDMGYVYDSAGWTNIKLVHKLSTYDVWPFIKVDYRTDDEINENLSSLMSFDDDPGFSKSSLDNVSKKAERTMQTFVLEQLIDIIQKNNLFVPDTLPWTVKADTLQYHYDIINNQIVISAIYSTSLSSVDCAPVVGLSLEVNGTNITINHYNDVGPVFYNADIALNNYLKDFQHLQEYKLSNLNLYKRQYTPNDIVIKMEMTNEIMSANELPLINVYLATGTVWLDNYTDMVKNEISVGVVLINDTGDDWAREYTTNEIDSVINNLKKSPFSYVIPRNTLFTSESYKNYMIDHMTGIDIFDTIKKYNISFNFSQFFNFNKRIKYYNSSVSNMETPGLIKKEANEDKLNEYIQNGNTKMIQKFVTRQCTNLGHFLYFQKVPYDREYVKTTVSNDVSSLYFMMSMKYYPIGGLLSPIIKSLPKIGMTVDDLINIIETTYFYCIEHGDCDSVSIKTI